MGNIKRSTAKKRRDGNRDTYMKFRTRWRHVLLIDQRIRSGQAPNCRQLADELEVSRRTVLRDIDFMRYDLGAPVEYDARRRGYVYTEPNWVMPSVRITEGELFALMVAEQALEAYAGTTWTEPLRRVFDRMIASLPERVEVAPRSLLDRVQFQPEAAAVVDPVTLEAVAAAVKKNRTLRISYQSLGHTEPKQYVVDPYILRRARGAWYLIGRDHRSGNVPMFHLGRVRRVEHAGGTFDYHASGFDPKTYFDATFGVYETSARYKCVIEFRGCAAQLVRERRWSASQKLKKLPGGRVRFEVTAAHLDDVWPWVLSWGAEAKAIKPKELIRIVSDQAGKAARQYARPTGRS